MNVLEVTYADRAGKLQEGSPDRIKLYTLPVALNVADVKALTTAQCNSLRCGDIVTKEDSTGKHAYIVTYKKDDTGMCLTYADGSGYIETVSYDLTGDEWVYNSTDVFKGGEDIAALQEIVDVTNDKIIVNEITSTEYSIGASKPIIETMSGYTSSVTPTDTDKAVNPIYIGVCKNGNKLTFVVFASVTKLTTGAHSINFSFGIPSSVGEKLIPFNIGGAYYLDYRVISCVQKSDWRIVTTNLDVTKSSNTAMNFAIYDTNFVENEETYIRIEQTFLLSDNMVS